MRKAYFVLAVLLAMSFSLTGCGTPVTPATTPTETSEQTTEKPRVLFVSVVSGGVAWGAGEKGFMDACEDLGWDGQYVVPTVTNDFAKLIELFETAVTNDYDFLMCVCSQKEMAADVLARAKKKGMVVISVNTKVGEEVSDAWIGTDPTGMGKAQAQTVLKEAEKDGLENITLAYIQTRLVSPTQNQQFEVMCEEIKKVYPNAEFIHDECDSNAQTASDKIGAYIKTYPDLNVIVCADGYGAPGIANYIEGNGLQDDIITIGIDDSPELLEFVTNGILRCTIAQDFYSMGYEGLKLGDIVYKGGTIKYDNDSGTIIIYPEDAPTHLELLKSRGLL